MSDLWAQEYLAAYPPISLGEGSFDNLLGHPQIDFSMLDVDAFGKAPVDGTDDSPVVQCSHESELDLLLSAGPHWAVNTSPYTFPAAPEDMPQYTLEPDQPSVAASSDSDKVCNILPPPRETEVDRLASTDTACKGCQEALQNPSSGRTLSRFKAFGYLYFQCNQPGGCTGSFINLREHDPHPQLPQDEGHGRVSLANLESNKNECAQCSKVFKSKAHLLRHAKTTQHIPYACKCGATFSRIDILARHLRSLKTTVPQHPCKYCKRHRGQDGFHRKDHLVQHIRNYHHFEIDGVSEMPTPQARLQYTFPTCPHPSCPQYRGEEFRNLSRTKRNQDKPFNSQSEYTKHMRDEHDESSFPCDVFGCSRVGRKGYFREKDLIKHRAEHHPDAGAYQPKGKETHLQCLEPHCHGRLLEPSSFSRHYLSYHRGE